MAEGVKLVEYRIIPGQNSEAQVELNLTQEEYKKREKEKEANLLERKRRIAEIQLKWDQEHKNFDSEALKLKERKHREFDDVKNPGEKELKASLNTFSSWREVGSSELYTLPVLFRPPRNFKKEEFSAEVKETVGDILKIQAETQLTKRLLELATGMKLHESMKKVRTEEEFVVLVEPLLWLSREMRKLKVKEEFAKKVSFDFQRLLAFPNTDKEGLWQKVVHYRNGFVKSLVELHKFVVSLKSKEVSVVFKV